MGLLIQQFTAWRVKHIADKQFVYILSVTVGFLAGMAAVLIKNSVHFISQKLTGLDGRRIRELYVYYLSCHRYSLGYVLY
ncbi:MAG: hypothetical protein R2764_04085 [Bacteroidales bacterium]